MIARMRRLHDDTYRNELLTMFEIDPKADLKRMSKGMKQKIGIVAAFMHNPELLILDEPTSGLDPLMQNRSVELIQKEKAKGKTMLMSSHIFEEVERTCDKIALVKDSRLIQEVKAEELQHRRKKSYHIGLHDVADMRRIANHVTPDVYSEATRTLSVSIGDDHINAFIQLLATCKLRYLKEEAHTLEDYFMKFYGGQTK